MGLTSKSMEDIQWTNLEPSSYSVAAGGDFTTTNYTGIDYRMEAGNQL